MQTTIWTQPQFLAAIVTGIVALVLALWNFFSGQKSLKDIEILKNVLAQKKSENDARRAYEFDARKRLYEEYEPLLFQLMEASENAIHRVKSLARTARDGNLDDKGWLSQFNYYTKSTIYKLLVPIAIYKIMQKKLTLVDINVDKSIGLRYKLAKQIYISYTDDFEFAKLFKNIDYDPNNLSWRELRNVDSGKYWRQGLPMGLLDKIIDTLIEKDEKGKEGIISFGEFEKRAEQLNTNKTSDLHLSRDIFFTFHPQKRPILWRILIAQTIILQTLLDLRDYQIDKITDDLVRELLFKKQNMDEFLWSKNNELESEMREPFDAAVEYFKIHF